MRIEAELTYFSGKGETERTTSLLRRHKLQRDNLATLAEARSSSGTTSLYSCGGKNSSGTI